LRELFSRLAGDDKGAVMAEAAIMLPVFILIWASILYIHFAFRDAQRNIATLRDHTWSYALNSCTTTAPAPTELSTDGTLDGSSTGSVGGLEQALKYLPSAQFFIDEFSSRRSLQISRPTMLGGGSRTLEWKLMMLCNERQRDDDDPLWEVWADLGFL
jgi:hypothetical protein